MIEIKEMLARFQPKEKESPTVVHYTDYLKLALPQIEINEDVSLPNCEWQEEFKDEIFLTCKSLGFSKCLQIKDSVYSLRLEKNHIARIKLIASNSKLNIFINGFSLLVFDGKIESSSIYLEINGGAIILFIPNISGRNKILFNAINSKLSVIKFKSYINDAALELKFRGITKDTHVDFSFDPEIYNANVIADLRGINYSGKLILRGNPQLYENSSCDFSVSGINFGGEFYGIPELTINSSSSFGKHSLDIRNLPKESIEYLRTRGLSESQAKDLLLDSFILDFISK
jgi:hypothetical protein